MELIRITNNDRTRCCWKCDTFDKCELVTKVKERNREWLYYCHAFVMDTVKRCGLLWGGESCREPATELTIDGMCREHARRIRLDTEHDMWRDIEEEFLKSERTWKFTCSKCGSTSVELFLPTNADATIRCFECKQPMIGDLDIYFLNAKLTGIIKLTGIMADKVTKCGKCGALFPASIKQEFCWKCTYGDWK